MANQLDELNPEVREEGLDTNVIVKKIPAEVGVGSKIFEILLWVCGILPGVIFLFMKTNAQKHFDQLQQKIQRNASQIDNFLEQRVMVLQNCARLLDKAIDLDKSTYENIAKFRSGNVADADAARNEIGGQIDAFYNFRRGTAIGGKRGMKVHANFSTYYGLDYSGKADGKDFLFRDFSFDVERQWTKKFKSVLLYSFQDYNKHNDNNGNFIGKSHIIVADLLYKWTPTVSTRMELQYLAAKEDQGDWMAGLLELNLAPHWSVFASDMWNHGSTRLHYYNAGVSYTIEHLRVSAGYGRYKAGFICSGGVCRSIPAYTGANITLTASF